MEKPPKGVQSRAILSFGNPDTDWAVGLRLLCRDAENVTQALSEGGLWNGKVRKMRAIEFADDRHVAAWEGFHHERCKKTESTMILIDVIYSSTNSFL